MDIYEKEQALEKKAEIVERIKKGEVFIYPTDTIYGLGCDAKNKSSVERIKQIKGRDNKPLPILVPSKDWIRNNLIVDDYIEDWLKKLPGPYTFILESENTIESAQVIDNVAPGSDWLGVRMIESFFQDFVTELGVPVVTTSVNISGNEPIKDIAKLPLEIKEKVDFIINDRVLDNPPSTLVDFHTHEPKIIRRN